MGVTREEVARIAGLAKLRFTDSEAEAFTAQFQRILEYIEKLEEIDVRGIEPTSHAPAAEGEQGSPMREDAAGTSLPEADALSEAPDGAEGHFRVPSVI